MTVKPSMTDQPFTFNVAGLLGDGLGANRTYDIENASVALPDELALAAPVPGTSAYPDQPRHHRRRTPDHGARGRVRALPSTADDADRHRPRGGVPPLDRPRGAAGRSMPPKSPRRSASPTTTSSTSSLRSATPSRSPSRSRHSIARIAPGCASSAACRSMRANTTTRMTTSIRDWRPCGHSSRLTRTDGRGRFTVDSAVGATALPPERRPAITPHARNKEPSNAMGVPKRRVSHARQGERRAHLAINCPGSSSVRMPPDEAAAPRLPELRLLPGSAGRAAEACQHRRRRLAALR